MQTLSKKSSNLIIFLSWAAYTVAYIGRLNFNSFIEPIRTQLGSTKTELGLVGSFFFFAYGLGQLVHGILSKKYNTRFSVAIALVGSACVNLAMASCTDASMMKYIWLLNGVFQSILWSSVIKTLSKKLSDDMLTKAIVVMSTPPAVGTFIVYGSAALMSSAGASFRWMFIIPAALLVVVGTVWFIVLGRLEGERETPAETKTDDKETGRVKPTPAFFGVMTAIFIAAVANGFIKDGVTTWTPSILKENYGMNESLSIFVTVALPLIAIFGAWFSTALFEKIKSSSSVNMMLYAVETAVLIGVFLLASKVSGKGSPVLLILLFGVSAMMMAAVNNVITSILPMFMRDSMNAGLLAGVFDTFCYVGSTLSTTLLGFIADRGSWNGVFLCLLIFAALAFVVCGIMKISKQKIVV